ncbi:MAG: PilZ domain-containing protein [Candidatus Omnitrophota bacterium]
MPGGEFEDKRVFERVMVNLPVRFLDAGSNKEGVGRTENISAKGLGFYTDEQLLPMTPLEMWVELPDKGESLYTRGEVVWSRGSGNKYRAGVNLERADLMGMSRLLRVV